MVLHKTTDLGPVCLLMFSIWGCQALGAEGVALYRCNLDGEIEFRQTACEAGDETLQRVTDSSRGLTPSEPGLRQKKVTEKTDRVSRPSSRKASERQCWKKRQQLHRVERRLRAGYRASQYQSLHERQREYEDFIRRFCR